jgi:hypothetical protein
VQNCQDPGAGIWAAPLDDLFDWIHRRPASRPDPFRGDSGNRDQASRASRHASLRPAAPKKPPLETFAVAVGLEQTEISGYSNVCS